MSESPYSIRPRVHGVRTGFVWLRDFDLGMVTTLGGRLIVGKEGRLFRVTIPRLPEEERDIPIYMVTPEQPLVSYTLPRFVVRRESWEPALNRWHPYTEEYRCPSPLGTPVMVPDSRGPTSEGPSQATIEGHTRYETKIQAWPYDITYGIEVWARYENFAQHMLFHVMRTFPPYGKMQLKDSLGDTREYDVFAESGPVGTQDIMGMTDRSISFAYSVRVTGEIDLEDEAAPRAAQTFDVELTPKRPSDV